VNVTGPCRVVLYVVLCFVVGLAGFLPIYPRTVMRARRNRERFAKWQAKLAEQELDDETNTDKQSNLPQS